MQNARLSYFIRVTNVELFNALVQTAEQFSADHAVRFDTRRHQGYYELTTASAALWRKLYLYGQMLAQAQDDYIEGGELPA